MTRLNFLIFFLFIFQILPAQEKQTLQFRGCFLPDTSNIVLITFHVEKSKLTGSVKYLNNYFENKLEGYINKENEFRVFELDTNNSRNGNSIKGVIDAGHLKGSYSAKGNTIDFDFEEVQANGTNGDYVHIKRKNKLYTSLEENFKEYPSKNMYIKYDDLAPTMDDYTAFIDKEITKVSSYQAPFTIKERLPYIQRASYGGKFAFENFDGEKVCTGLVFHMYFYSQIDGPLFNTYLFIYDSYGIFVQALVLYEAIDRKKPYIHTKVSSSLVFMLTDLSTGNDDEMIFKIDEEGKIEFKD